MSNVQQVVTAGEGRGGGGRGGTTLNLPGKAKPGRDKAAIKIRI